MFTKKAGIGLFVKSAVLIIAASMLFSGCRTTSPNSLLLSESEYYYIYPHADGHIEPEDIKE